MEMLQKPNCSEKLLDHFLKERHKSQSKAIAMLLFDLKLRELFVE